MAEKPTRRVAFTLIDAEPTPEQRAAWDRWIARVAARLTAKRAAAILAENAREESA